jgi:hypothetical protein
VQNGIRKKRPSGTSGMQTEAQKVVSRYQADNKDQSCREPLHGVEAGIGATRYGSFSCGVCSGKCHHRNSSSKEGLMPAGPVSRETAWAGMLKLKLVVLPVSFLDLKHSKFYIQEKPV